MTSRRRDGITHTTSLAALLALAAGCTPIVRSTGNAPYPNDGIHLLYSRDGRLIQKTVWRSSVLVVAWQYEQPEDFRRQVVDAASLGQRLERPAPRWVQAVERGTGRLYYLDEDGQNIGFADYLEGRYVRGAH